MILELTEEQTNLLKNPASTKLVMAPVSLRGRQTPHSPLIIQQAESEILPNAEYLSV